MRMLMVTILPLIVSSIIAGKTLYINHYKLAYCQCCSKQTCRAHMADINYIFDALFSSRRLDDPVSYTQL